MAGMIRLSPEELESIASRYGVESTNVLDIVGNLDGLMETLHQIWEGSSKEAFHGQYEELRPSFMQMVELLEDINQQLSSAAAVMRDTDTNIASQIRG